MSFQTRVRSCPWYRREKHEPGLCPKRFQTLHAGLSPGATALSRYRDIIDLSIGDTDIVTDGRIIDAAFADAKTGYTHYGNPKEDLKLVTALCRAWEEDFGQPVAEDHVLITAPGCFGIGLAMLGILSLINSIKTEALSLSVAVSFCFGR